MTSRLLVLCYHNVDPTWCFAAAPGAGQRGLERQLRAIKRWANVVPLHSAIMTLASGGKLPRRAVALSFDDGYRDNLALAVPMLQRLGLPATFFLVPGLLSNDVFPWWEVLSWAVSNAAVPTLTWQGSNWPLEDARGRRTALDAMQRSLKRRSRSERDTSVLELMEELEPAGSPPSAQNLFLDWDEGMELIRRGFTIGSHTCAHAILSAETPEAQARDLVESRQQLQKRLSVAAELLAYPNGTAVDYDEATLQAARQAGHSQAFTTVEGLNRPTTPSLELRRVVMYPERGLTELAANLRYALRNDE